MVARGLRRPERPALIDADDAVPADITFVGFLLGHGGDALQMLELAAGMKRCGATVQIIVPAVTESITLAQRAQARGVPCHRTSMMSVSMDGAPQRLGSMLSLLRSIRSPVVHFHSGNSCLPRMTMAALEALRYRRSFATLQSPYETIVPGSLRARVWAATASRRLAAVVSPSDHGSRFQVRCGIPVERTATIRNSIDLGRWSSGDGEGVRRRLGIDAADPLIVFSSRLDQQKRPLDAVRMLAGVTHRFPRACLLVVGDGELSDAMLAEGRRLDVADRVRLVGYQTNVEDWIAAATVWVLPTERENFSIALLEAMAAGRVVLSTSCPGNDEILVDGHNASVFDVGDVADGTARLAALLGDASLRRRLGDGALATAQAFSNGHMVDAYRRLYLEEPAVAARLRSLSW